MRDLFLDIETIPSQDATVKAEIRAPLEAAVRGKCEGFVAEIAGLRPPGNLKDPAKIAAWEETERPKKKAALEEARAECERGLEATVENAWRRTSFDGALCQIVAIAWAFDDQKVQHLHAGKKWTSLVSERDMLQGFYQRLSDVPAQDQVRIRFCGHWISEFDLRVIFQRSVIHGVRPPLWIPFSEPAWSARIYDTMVRWSGSKGKVTLDKVCRVLGVAGKGLELGGDDIDGSKVWDFVRDGKIEQVAQYCVGDVERVREVHARMTFGGVL